MKKTARRLTGRFGTMRTTDAHGLALRRRERTSGLTDALRVLGHDVLTAHEAGRANQKLP